MIKEYKTEMKNEGNWFIDLIFNSWLIFYLVSWAIFILLVFLSFISSVLAFTWGVIIIPILQLIMNILS